MLTIFKIFDKDDTIKDWVKSVDFQKIWQKEKEDMKIRWMIQTETKHQNVIKLFIVATWQFGKPGGIIPLTKAISIRWNPIHSLIIIAFCVAQSYSLGTLLTCLRPILTYFRMKY